MSVLTKSNNSVFQLLIIVFIIVFPWFGLPGYKHIVLFLLIPITVYLGFRYKHKNSYWFFTVFILSYSTFIAIYTGLSSIFLYTFTIFLLMNYSNSTLTTLGMDGLPNKKVFIVVLFISLILINFTWDVFEKERYGIFVEDSNFSAMALIVIALIFYTATRFKILSIIYIIIVVILTQSRVSALTIILFFASTFLMRYKKLSMILGYFLILVSIAGQMAIGFLFNKYMIQHNIHTESIIDRFSNINDTGNFERFYIFRKTVELLSESIENLLFGIPDFSDVILQWGMKVPHNWFIMMTALYGLIYSIIFTIFLITIIHVQNKFTPVFYSIIFIGAFLNISAVMSPIILTLIFSSIFFSDKINAYQNKLPI